METKNNNSNEPLEIELFCPNGDGEPKPYYPEVEFVYEGDKQRYFTKIPSCIAGTRYLAGYYMCGSIYGKEEFVAISWTPQTGCCLWELQRLS